MVQQTRSLTRIAAACATVSASGLIGAIAAYERVIRGFPVWIGGCLMAGVILGGFKSQRLRGMARRALLCAAFLPPAALGLYWTHWLGLPSIDVHRGDISLAPTPAADSETFSEFIMLLPLTAVTYVVATLIILVATIWTITGVKSVRSSFNLTPVATENLYKIALGAATGLEFWIAFDSLIGT